MSCLYCWKQIKNDSASQETIKKAYITKTSALVIGAKHRGERGEEKKKKWAWEAYLSNRLIACLEGSFTCTDKGDVLFNGE